MPTSVRGRESGNTGSRIARAVVLDVVGRFENSASGFTAILERLGAPAGVAEMATTATNDHPAPTMSNGSLPTKRIENNDSPKRP
jgi:hypothetical protein